MNVKDTSKLWTKTDNGYVSEMSTLEGNGAMYCPICQTFFTLGLPLRDKSGEILKWTIRCRDCKTYMHIFND